MCHHGDLEADHGWGKDWNVLIGHSAGDLDMLNPAIAYYSEFDHLQFGDIEHLLVGNTVMRGEEIGVVRHPGENSAIPAGGPLGSLRGRDGAGPRPCVEGRRERERILVERIGGLDRPDLSGVPRPD